MEKELSEQVGNESFFILPSTDDPHSSGLGVEKKTCSQTKDFSLIFRKQSFIESHLSEAPHSGETIANT